MGIVLDISNHDYSTFNAECFRNNGVERVIVNAWDYRISEDMIRKCRAFGIKSEDIYCFLYFGLPHERREVSNALALAKNLGGIKRIWLDVEARPPHEASNMTPQKRIDIVSECAAEVERAGYSVGIYTGRWYWVPYMANTTAFSKYPLWLAYYGKNDGTQPPIKIADFGGWRRVSVHQFTSRFALCGRYRDANYWMLDEGKEEQMTSSNPTAREIVEAILNDKEARNALAAALLADAPVHLALDKAKRQAFLRAIREAWSEAVQEEYPKEAADPVRMLALIWRRMKRAGDIMSNPQPPQE
jgi:hypothetical protein